MGPGGSYKYAPLKLILTQIVDKDGNNIQVYVHGNMNKDSHLMIEFREGLPSGKYVIMYKGTFTKDNPEKKLVVSLYANKEQELYS